MFSIDLSSVSGVDVLTGQVNQLVQRGLGVRFGFVPVLDGESGDGKYQTLPIIWLARKEE